MIMFNEHEREDKIDGLVKKIFPEAELVRVKNYYKMLSVIVDRKPVFSFCWNHLAFSDLNYLDRIEKFAREYEEMSGYKVEIIKVD